MLLQAIVYVVPRCQYTVDLQNVQVKARFFVNDIDFLEGKVDTHGLELILDLLVLVVVCKDLSVVLCVMGVYQDGFNRLISFLLSTAENRMLRLVFLSLRCLLIVEPVID